MKVWTVQDSGSLIEEERVCGQVRRSPRSGVWLGTCAELGIVTQGTDEADAHAALCEAILLFLRHEPMGLKRPPIVERPKTYNWKNETVDA